MIHNGYVSRFFLVLMLLFSTCVLGGTQEQAPVPPPPPVVPHFFRYPITVYIPDNFTVEQIIAAFYAVEYWNSALGVRVFEEKIVTANEAYRLEAHAVADLNTQAVTMRFIQFPCDTITSVRPSCYAGLTTLRAGVTTGLVHSAVVWLDSDLNEHDTFFVAAHELGHVLGLQHDSSLDSIMYSYPINSAGSLQEDDRQAILDLVHQYM